jgi:hypothetical protein
MTPGIIIPAYDLKHLPYYQAMEVKMQEFGAVTHGIIFIPNFMKILSDII